MQGLSGKCLVRNDSCFIFNIQLDCLSINSVAYAKDHQPCIIFMDEIDAIGNWRGERVLYFLMFLSLFQVVRGSLKVLRPIVRYSVR